VLRVAELGEEWRIFSTEEFHPPTIRKTGSGAKVVRLKATHHEQKEIGLGPFLTKLLAALLRPILDAR
jgi:hypothetical protein